MAIQVVVQERLRHIGCATCDSCCEPNRECIEFPLYTFLVGSSAKLCKSCINLAAIKLKYQPDSRKETAPKGA